MLIKLNSECDIIVLESDWFYIFVGSGKIIRINFKKKFLLAPKYLDHNLFLYETIETAYPYSDFYVFLVDFDWYRNLGRCKNNQLAKVE